MGRSQGEAARSEEWVDGFLFVGNQMALDFLNTRLVSGGEEIDLLPDAMALRRWLVAAEFDSDQGTGAPDGGKSASSPTEELAAEARAFRERLRQAVSALEAGRAPAARFVGELNALLFDHPRRLALSLANGEVQGAVVFEKGFAGRFWGEIAAASAAVLTGIERLRLRKCENCVVHFYDTSKKGSRRWCSMNLCGNKLKVAAYQGRRRRSGSEDSTQN